jgi:hypothetical protein
MVLGSGISDPGSRGQKGTGSRIQIRYTADNNLLFQSTIYIFFHI